MGCDIHVFIEYSRDGGKTWQADKNHVGDEDNSIQDVSVANRDYQLFGLIAGVRCGGQMYDTRRIPCDVSDTVQHAVEQWAGNGHSHSWLTLDEFADAVKKNYDLWRKENPKAHTFKAAMKNAQPIAFYEWGVVHNKPDARKYLDLSYADMLAYCNKQLQDMEAECILLNDPIKPKCRIVFFFDN